MKIRLYLPLLAAFSFTAVFAQGIRYTPVQEQRASYPIAGSHLLWEKEASVREYFRLHPEALDAGRLRKTSAWNFSVGSQQTWKSVNFTTNSYFSVPSTCKAVGTHCYVFVEDASWTGGKVNQAAVDSVQKAFDDSTPANPSKGIYQTDVDTFGDPPDVDGDAKIIILILDIKDGYSGSGGYVAGYFDPANEGPLSSSSNHGEIYYLDCNPANLATHSGLVDGMSTTAHEFQHMIHFHYDPNEITFINEGCSTFAEVNAGYQIYDQTGFVSEPNHYLFDWRTGDNTAVLKDYSRATRFTVYLHDQFSTGIFKPLVQSALHDTLGVNAALQSVGAGLGFGDVMGNWFVANIANDQTQNASYGYTYPGISTVSPQIIYNPNVGTTTKTVQRYAADYLSFRAGSDLSTTFTLPGGSSLKVKAVKKGSGGTQVVDVTPGTPFTVPEFGTSVTEVDFVIMNGSRTSNQDYSFTASGTAGQTTTEVKWETTEPTGYYIWSPSDTICVTFNGYPGGSLDSLRIALRRPGSISGGVYQLATTGASPLGKKLTSITASISDSTTLPYPVPYKNWSTVDLTSANISADNPFAVAFVIGSVPNAPGVMVTTYPGQSPYHSYTYLKASESSSGAGWYFITDSDSTIAIYVIRAYVSFVTGVKQVIDLMPSNFSLDQNYPNPFNPSTRIEYTIPKEGFVSLKVYDMLGKEVANLVNEKQSAGEKSVTFEASWLPTGLYFYSLRTGTYTETKKMLLLK